MILELSQTGKIRMGHEGQPERIDVVSDLGYILCVNQSPFNHLNPPPDPLSSTWRHSDRNLCKCRVTAYALLVLLELHGPPPNLPLNRANVFRFQITSSDQLDVFLY